MSGWAISSTTIPKLQERASTMDSSVTVDANDTNKAIYEKYINQLGNGWTLGVFSKWSILSAWNSNFWTCLQILFQLRLILIIQTRFKILKIQTCNVISVLKMTLLSVGHWSVRGIKHKYLFLYFNNQFPFVHQNFVNINLGISSQLVQTPSKLKLSTQGQDKLRHQKFNSHR